MEPSMTFAELRVTEPEKADDLETASELDDGPAEIGPRGIAGEVEKYILLSQIKTYGIIKYFHNSPRQMDEILNSVECLQAQIEYLRSKRKP